MGNVFARERMRRPVSAQGIVARRRFFFAAQVDVPGRHESLQPMAQRARALREGAICFLSKASDASTLLKYVEAALAVRPTTGA